MARGLEELRASCQGGRKSRRNYWTGFLGTQSFNQGNTGIRIPLSILGRLKWHMLSGEESQIEDVYGFERAALRGGWCAERFGTASLPLNLLCAYTGTDGTRQAIIRISGARSSMPMRSSGLRPTEA